MSTRGLVLGKFMPPHNGHLYLLQFAERFVDHLTVVVDVPDTDAAIPIAQRCAWLQELMPHADIKALPEPHPQTPEEHPDFWRIWRNSLRQLLGHDLPDYVFASETYGQRLAQELDARFIPVDHQRSAVPISASRIRARPQIHWTYLPAPVRAYYTKRISISGPESCGKSTLAAKLAKHFQATLVPEYARSLLEQQNGTIEAGDMRLIALGQAASEDSLAKQCNGALICDTDPLATCVWNHFLGQQSDQSVIDSIAEQRHYDLTLLCDIDVPWVADEVRYLPTARQEFFDHYRESLERAKRNYVCITGNWEERWITARSAVEELLAPSLRAIDTAET